MRYLNKAARAVQLHGRIGFAKILRFWSSGIAEFHTMLYALKFPAYFEYCYVKMFEIVANENTTRNTYVDEEFLGKIE